MKYAMLLHNRNKAKYLEMAVRSVFVQSGPPIEILLSDAGSTDGSKALLDKLAAEYTGPHTVRRLDCPCADSPGMAGLNAHLNWAMAQTDAELVMTLSGDDYDLGQRSELTIKAYEEFHPSMVLMGMYYVDEQSKYLGETPWLKEDGWCKLEEIHSQYIGGSTIQAWTHEFFDKMGGLTGVGSPDVVMPFLACLDKGAYYVHSRQHCYRKVVGLDNTGLESVYAAYPENSPERLQIEEQIHFQVSAGLYACLSKMQDTGIQTDAAVYALAQAILDRNASWVNVRQRMSFAGIPPAAFRV